MFEYDVTLRQFLALGGRAHKKNRRKKIVCVVCRSTENSMFTGHSVRCFLGEGHVHAECTAPRTTDGGVELVNLVCNECARWD